MTVFTRTPFWYWGDRFTLLGIFLFIGILCLVMGIQVARGNISAASAGPMIYGIPIGVVVILAGLWFFSRPWPRVVEISSAEIRIQYQPSKTVTIPRADFIGAKVTGNLAHHSCGIFYRDGDKERNVALYAGYADQSGTVYRKVDALCDAINDAAGVK